MMHFKTTSKERRRDPRITVQRPVKIRCEQSGKYLTGITHDVSSGGALIHTERHASLTPGQQVLVGIAWIRRNALLRTDEMIPAKVTRCLGIDGQQNIAVCFEQPQELALSA